MEEKVLNKVKEAGLDINDLTQEEIEDVRKDIEAEEKGLYVLDGALWHASRRIRKEKARDEFEAMLKGK